MKIMITFRHMQPSSAIKDFIHEKLEKLDRFNQGVGDAHVILSIERHLQIAEVVFTAKKFKARGKDSTSDMYASIEGAVEKIEKSLRKRHDKKVSSKTKGSNPFAEAS